MTVDYVNRFWSKVDRIGPDDCWEWKGARLPQGYGQFWNGVKLVRAHRYSLLLAKPLISGKPLVLHSCDNPPCVNPSHLHWGDHADNMREAWDRGLSGGIAVERSLQSHCVNGHQFDGGNTTTYKGSRVCRECSRIRSYEHKYGRTAPVSLKQRTHCKRGHLLTGDNIYIRKDGSKTCRKCKNTKSVNYVRTLIANSDGSVGG